MEKLAESRRLRVNRVIMWKELNLSIRVPLPSESLMNVKLKGLQGGNCVDEISLYGRASSLLFEREKRSNFWCTLAGSRFVDT